MPEGFGFAAGAKRARGEMMRGKSLALLVLALGCGLVASIGVTQVIAKRHTETPAPSVEMESIFVAMADIALGDPLTAQVLKLEPWPKSKIPEGAFTKVEDIEGRRARARLFAGEPIIERKLLKRGESSGGISPLIPKGMRVVSVKVDQVSGGGGLILPGDRVDVVVYLTQALTRGIPETSTRTVLQDIKVFAVNDQFNLDSEGSDKRSITNARTVSLLVTPAQAQKVMLAGEMGQIRLVLRSPEDDEQASLATATAQDILGGPGAGNRDMETLVESELPAEDDQMQGFLDFLNENMHARAAAQSSARGPQAVPPAPENTTWNMRIVRAGKIEDIQLYGDTKAGEHGLIWHHGAPAPTPPSDGQYQPFPGAPASTVPAPAGPTMTSPLEEPEDEMPREAEEDTPPTPQ